MKILALCLVVAALIAGAVSMFGGDDGDAAARAGAAPAAPKTAPETGIDMPTPEPEPAEEPSCCGGGGSCG